MKKIKRIKMMTVLLLGLGFLDADAQQAATAAGGTASGSGGSATYSAGQVTYTQLSSASGTVGQGVQQPFEYLIGVDEVNQISLSMLVFPNPVNSILNLKVDQDKWQGLFYELSDMSGRVVLRSEVLSSMTSIPMEKIANAEYLLRISNSEKEIKTFKLFKTN